MTSPQNSAALLRKPGQPLEVAHAPMPAPGAAELLVRNRAVAVNPLDWHMQDSGVFVKEWPAILGCDVAGEVQEVGEGVERFKKGDRVIGHCVGLVSGRASDGAFAHYTIVKSDRAAVLPASIPFTDGVVLPFMLEAAVCVLANKEPGPCMPGVLTPALGLPYPTLQDAKTPPQGKVLVIYGASSSVGLTTMQLAVGCGIDVVAVAGARNHGLVTQCGALSCWDHTDGSVVEHVVGAVKSSGSKFIGIFDAISMPDTYAKDLAILEKLGGGHLACTHPPPTENVPANVNSGMIFACNDIAGRLFEEFVTGALASGKLKCLPAPEVVGKGLEHINEALKRSKAGVSARKLVVEL